MVPSTPAFVGEVRLPAGLGENRCVEFDANQTPGAAGDVGEIRGRSGYPDDRGGGVVGSHRGQRDRAAQSDQRDDRGAEVADDSPRRHHPRQQAGWQAEGVDEFGGPLAGAGVQQSGGGGVGVFGDPLPGEPVAEQVGDQQRLHPGVVDVCVGRELVHRVERQELQTVDGVELFGGYRGMHQVDDGVWCGRPGSAGGCRSACRRRRGVRSRRPRSRWRCPRASGSILAASRNPATMSWYRPRMSQYSPSGRVTAPLRNRRTSVISSTAGPDPAEDHPAAGGAEINRGQADRALDPRPATALGHRRNAAATPESTGMCRPVVCDRSPAVRA